MLLKLFMLYFDWLFKLKI